ncbi:hypothetical protein KJ570_03365 [Patescibacteria group bacterium]|nr:hypothetical protein [Patescibacteria group bacterium]MBU2036163.1 hypothetical protein [Patescibacteria group bacterium]
MKKLIFPLLLITAILERTLFDLGPNFEFITTALILSAFYLGKKQSLLLIFLILLVSDFIIGNTNIFVFTWSGFLIPALFVSNILKKIKLNKIILGTGLGISSNIFFYLWTNFGVWVLDSWGMYPNTIQGLLQSYINGIPFLKYQLVSTLLLLPVTFVIFETIKIIAIQSKSRKTLSTTLKTEFIN